MTAGQISPTRKVGRSPAAPRHQNLRPASRTDSACNGRTLVSTVKPDRDGLVGRALGTLARTPKIRTISHIRDKTAACLVRSRLHLIRSVRSSVPAGAARAGPAARQRPAAVAPGPGDAAAPPRAPSPRRWDVPRAARLAAALLGLAAIATYLVIALFRLSYPFPLEYLESNSLVEVQRILTGHALYAAPTVGYVPDGYPPLYFATSAAAASVLGLSYLPLRLVSLVSSLACFAVLARLVQRETASAAAGIAAAGLLAATYFVTDTWFDVARVDSLFIALSAAALYTARWMRRTRGAVATGLLLAAAFLTKQNGLAEGVAVLTALAFGPRRRLAWPAALTYGAVLGISTLALGLASRGWYVFYVFVLLSRAHPEGRRVRAVLDRIPAARARHRLLRPGPRGTADTPGAGRRLCRAGRRELRRPGPQRRQGQRPAARLPRGGAARGAGDGRPAPAAWRVPPRTGWPAAGSRTGGRGWPAGGPPPRPPRWSSRSWPCW